MSTTPMNKYERLESMLEAQRADGRWREVRLHSSAGGVLDRDGARVLNLSSNDYLDLAGDERLKQAARTAIDAFGCGATASRLMSGHLPPHAQCEAALASLTGMPAALVFPSGFQANLGVLTALSVPGTVIFCDKLNHASIIDGARLSGARLRVYKHVDMDDLARLLDRHADRANKIIVSDSIFSMDGDLAPVEKLAELAEAHDAFLVIDEAHAIGVYGERGGGLCQGRGVIPDVLVGTMSKALGSQGGFATGSTAIRDALVNRARSFIYTTGLAPVCAASGAAAIEIIAREMDLGAKLLDRTRHLARALSDAGVPCPRPDSPIVPVHVGGNDAVVRIAARLAERGILATGVRPPTVPKDTARLRLSVTLAHTEADLEGAAKAIAEALRKLLRR